MRFVGIQMVLSGEAQCARQIVAVSNGEGKIIAYAKPQNPTVSSHLISVLALKSNFCGTELFVAETDKG